jgi:predicted CDP-diglyceride synthetase/phosphatidate cytidylyltransferase
MKSNADSLSAEKDRWIRTEHAKATSSGVGLFRRIWSAGMFSPTAFVTRAVIITFFFGISELLGLREYTTFLSGTSANLNLSWQTAATFGLIHLLLYLGFILLVPIFLIAAALLTAWNRRVGLARSEIEKVERTGPLVLR